MFAFTSKPASKTKCNVASTHGESAMSVTIHQESVMIEIPPAIQETMESQIPPVIQKETNDGLISPTPNGNGVNNEGLDDGLEHDLNNCVHGGLEICGWDKLREQIMKDLERGAKTMPLTTTNQLLVLRNFTNLQLKGYGKMEVSLEIACQWHPSKGTHYARKVALACHYQVFEQLPEEK